MIYLLKSKNVVSVHRNLFNHTRVEHLSSPGVVTCPWIAGLQVPEAEGGEADSATPKKHQIEVTGIIPHFHMSLEQWKQNPEISLHQILVG